MARRLSTYSGALIRASRAEVGRLSEKEYRLEGAASGILVLTLEWVGDEKNQPPAGRRSA